MFSRFNRKIDVVEAVPTTQYVGIPIVSWESMSSEQRDEFTTLMESDGWDFYHRGLGLIIESRTSTEVIEADVSHHYNLSGMVQLSQKQVEKTVIETRRLFEIDPVNDFTDEEIELRKAFEDFANENHINKGPAAEALISLRRLAAAGEEATESHVDRSFKTIFGDRIGDILDFQNQQVRRLMIARTY